MKILLGLLCCLGIAGLHAQHLTTMPSGGNKVAMVGEQIGLTQAVIHYNRPGVKGREGKIWGQLVPEGYTDQGFGNTKQAPWRAGSNENTTIEFNTEVKVEGKPLAAGKYGFFVAYGTNECTLIFSKNSGSWGSYYYDPKEDALRVTVKPLTLEKSVEWLQFIFTNQTPDAATIELQWEKLAIPFSINVDLTATQLEIFRNELRTDKGFVWQTWDQAASWCLQNNTNLEQALLWADSASSATFGGNNFFQPQATKAMILQKMGKPAEADVIMKNAMPLASMNELHQYGRQLLGQKKAKEALEVFKMNYQKHPDVFTTLMGMVRGYSAVGDYKTALNYAKKAQPLAPDSNNKNNLDSIIKKLEAGQDVN